MKNGTKIALIVAAVLLAAGLMVCACVLAIAGPDAFIREEEESIVKTQNISEDFSSIRVLAADADIRLLLAEDGVCRVEYPESKYSSYEVGVEDGLLAVQYRDSRKWYQPIFTVFYLQPKVVRVYLPQGQYDAAMLHTASGDIAVDLGVEYKTAKCSTASGDIAWHAKVTESCDLNTASGDILLHDAQATGSVHVNTASGDCSITTLR